MSKGTRGPNRTEDERRIIYNGHLAGKTCDQITADLAVIGKRSLPPGSWKYFESSYKPALQRHPELFEVWVKHPPKAGDVPKD